MIEVIHGTTELFAFDVCRRMDLGHDQYLFELSRSREASRLAPPLCVALSNREYLFEQWRSKLIFPARKSANGRASPNA